MTAAKLVREWRTVSTDQGDIDVFVVAPKGSSSRVIVMLSEIFGVNSAMREKAVQFAELVDKV